MIVAAAVLTVVAFGVTRVVAIGPAPETQSIPAGVTVVLVGFFGLVSRRKARRPSSSASCCSRTGSRSSRSWPPLGCLASSSELGVALDLLLAVLVLQVLTGRMQSKFGALDLDHLTELRD